MRKQGTLFISLFFSWLRRRLLWFAHPVVVFVTLQIILAAIIILWVIWFVDLREELAQAAQAFGIQYVDSRYFLAFLVVGCVLLGMILIGTILLFVFGQKQTLLFRQQRRFVSSVTHELKSPLASIQLAFETLRARDVDENTRGKILEMIVGDIARLKRLIDQTLVSARLDANIALFKGKEVEINLRDLIDSVCQNVSYLDRRLSARLHINCESKLIIRAPAEAMRLIISNLLENAVKYSPEQSEISIDVTREADALKIDVCDHGVGLDKKEKRRIFKIFHRSDSAIAKAIPGTGIGLYIVNSTVKNIGGKVWAESPGRGLGATFHVSLPGTVVYP